MLDHTGILAQGSDLLSGGTARAMVLDPLWLSWPTTITTHWEGLLQRIMHHVTADSKTARIPSLYKIPPPAGTGVEATEIRSRRRAYGQGHTGF